MSAVEDAGTANGDAVGKKQLEEHQPPEKEEQQQRKEELLHASGAAAYASDDWVVLAQDYMSDTTSKVRASIISVGLRWCCIPRPRPTLCF